MDLMKSATRAGALAMALAGFAAIGQPALAATETCMTDKFMISVTDASAKACLDDQPSYSGDNPIIRQFFGMNYTLSSKSDEAMKGTGVVSFSGFENDDVDGDMFGEWSLGDLTGISSVLVGFKKGGQNDGLYALFELDGTSGTWQIKANGNVENNYSHLDIWYKLGDGTTTAIPLPASLPLFLAGLGGLGLITRRRRAC